MKKKETNSKNQEDEKRNGRWSKGISGNPAGRPAGSRNRASLAAEALLDGEVDRLTRKAIELALKGNTVALRLCLDRIAPPRKERSIGLELPHIKNCADIAKAMSRVLAAIAEGTISPAEGEVVAGVLEIQRDVIHTRELEARVEELERHLEEVQRCNRSAEL